MRTIFVSLSVAMIWSLSAESLFADCHLAPYKDYPCEHRTSGIKPTMNTQLQPSDESLASQQQHDEEEHIGRWEQAPETSSKVERQTPRTDFPTPVKVPQ
jgi:hypothetical protein